MRCLGRSSGCVTRSLLLLGFLQWATIAQFNTVFASAAETDLANGIKTREMAELEGSMARYRRSITHDEFSLRNLLQVSEKKITEHQEVRQQKIDEQNLVNEKTKEQQMILEKTVEDRTQSEPDLQGSDRFVDEFQLEHNAVLNKDKKMIVEVEKRTEERLNDNSKTDEQQKQNEEVQRKEGKTEEKNGPQEQQQREKRKVFEEESIQLEKGEPQKNNQEQQLVGEVQMVAEERQSGNGVPQEPREGQNVAEDKSNIEEEAQQVGDSLRITEQQHEDQKKAHSENTEKQPESDTENLQRNDERVEPEPKPEERLTEEKEIAKLTTEENHSKERQGPEEEKTEDWNVSESNAEDQKTEKEKPVEEEPFVSPEPPYLLGTTIKDWDEQRGSWLNANPQMKTTPDGKPRVLIVTGSQPEPCQTSTGDNFQMKSLKLKIDYARMHNYEIYYNFVWLDPLFGGFWVKLPTIRSLMLAHPEIEWFFWVDSDAVFTDMLFEVPFETYEGYNMVMWGIDDFFYAEKSWTAFNAGVFLIRNCQWTLDLIDKWSPMGPAGEHRNAYGKLLTNFLKGRGDWEADDQSALAYLMLTDEAVKAKVKLVDSPEYMLSGWWVPIVNTYEELMDMYHPGLGNSRWPWITHFTGCGPCYHDDTTPQFKNCMMQMDRAFHFADNQVLAYMGFQHLSLSSPEVICLRNETDRPLELLGVNPWAERIAEVAAMEGGNIS